MSRPIWNPDFAASIIGATVLVGITRHRPEGPVHDQFYGTVISADERAGIDVQLAGQLAGAIRRLPPDLTAFIPAQRPATYRLRATGETVTDPDYVATWEIHAPPG